MPTRTARAAEAYALTNVNGEVRGPNHSRVLAYELENGAILDSLLGEDGSGLFGDDDSIPKINNQEILLARPNFQETIFLADGQPDANPDFESTDGQNPDQVQVWRDILDGIPVNHPNVTSLVYAGDVTDRGIPSAIEAEENTVEPYLFPNAIRDLETRLPFNQVYAIAGNHDRGYETFEDRELIDPMGEFLRNFPKNFYYLVKGNTVYIFMGDMGDDTEGYITDYVFEWWLSVCRKYNNKNKIVVTHQSLPDIGLGGDAFAEDNDSLIKLGQRFVDALTGPDPIRVDVWFRGHHGVSTVVDASDQSRVSHGGTLFINCGLHIPAASELAGSDLSYVVMVATDGSDQVTFRRWDHKGEQFVDSAEVTHTFQNPLSLSSLPTFDGRFQMSELDPINGMQTIYRHMEFNDPKADGEDFKTEDIWFTRGILDDRRGFNIPRHEAGHKIELAGGFEENPENRTHNYGFGAAWVAHRLNGAEEDYSAEFVAYASTEGQDDDSKVEAIRGHVDGSLSTPAGLRHSWVSEWVEIDSTTASTDGTDFVHNLDISDPFIASADVYFWSGVAGDRVYDWGQSSPVSEVSRLDGSLSFKDENTVTIGVGNDGVFAVDNVDGGATQTFTSGFFLVCLSKRPNLPALPTP